MFASKKWASIFMNYCYSLSLLFIITTINLPTTFADENNGTFMYFFAYPDRNGNCPADVYSKYHIYNTPFLQLGQIMSYGGILFTVAVYGVRSAFGWRLTFFLDDLVIIFFGFSPVVPFYIIGQVCGRITDKNFRDSFIFIIMTCWGIIGWIIVSIIHDFNYRYDLSANRKYYLKIVTAVIHLICAVSILATDIFSTYYDSSLGTNSVYDILNVNFLSYFANAIYLIMSIYLICHFWQHESIKHGDLNLTGAVRFFPLRMYFMTLFLSVIQVFFAYAYVCSLEIIDSVFNFIVGMVSTRAIASFFSNKRIVYGYLMEVDDDRDLGATDEGRVDSDAKELRASHSILKRFLAFMLFLNYANGNFTWRASMVGYVDKEQIFFISERSSLKIRCRKIKYKNKENKENDCYLHRSILKIEKDRIDIEEYKKIDTLKKLEELKNEKDGITSLEEEEEEEEEIEAITIKKLNALKIQKNEIETVFKLFGRGKIISESGKKVIYRRWEATLNIEYDKMYLIQQVEIFRSKAANLKSKGVEGSAEMHWSKSIVSYEDEEENCTASDGELRIIIEDDKNLNCKWELEVRDDNKWRLRIKDNKNFLNDDEWRLKPEDLESGEWKLKLRDDKAYLVHRKRIGECKSLNIKNEEIVKLNRKVNLNCKWDLKNDGTKKLMYVHKEVINNREISKTIDMNNLNFIKLILEGDSRVRIKENKIHLEYKVKVLENADKYDELLSAENSILEEEISDSVSQSDGTATEDYNKRMWSNRDQSCGLVTEDKFFGWRAKNSTGNNFITRSCWNAILRKNRTDIYLDHEVQHKETIHMSVEGNKLINLGYDPKDNNNDRDIIKLTYDKIIYIEDFSKNFRSLTINKVFEIKKSDDGRSLEKLDKNNNIFTSWFCNNDELTIKTGNGDGNEIKFTKKCWRWSDRKPRYCIMDNNKSNCPRDNIIKIRIYADAIVRVTNTDNEMKRIVLEHGGKLEIKIKDDDSVKIVLFKKVQLNEYGLLRIQEGCVTHVEKPKDKGFVDLTKHGFLNFLIYNHKKQVKKLREQKEIEQAVGCVKQI